VARRLTRSAREPARDTAWHCICNRERASTAQRDRASIYSFSLRGTDRKPFSSKTMDARG